ncbi:MAG TPA: polysaccharide deacetylase family protein [Polyangiaceae bacterium]|nr:polysaccharide deacetylase family protein [Polyangiaceae bacterium]
MLRLHRERARPYERAAHLFGLCLLACACASPAPAPEPGTERAQLSSYGDHVAWSKKPPGLEPVDVPQFVAVTFDDNFVSGLGDVSGGMTWATTFLEPLKNPAASGFAPTWDGSPVRTTFFDNCVYLQDDPTKKSWKTAREAGHEIANHTVNHPNGGSFSAMQWTDEIAPCTAALSDPDSGVGVTVDEVRGFRAPYLAYDSELFGVLTAQGLWYDTSIQSCWADGDDGKACAWPYTLDQGSPDAVDLTTKFQTPSVSGASGLWEATPSVLFVPPDDLATQYGFEPGLRQRVPTDMPAPSFYEPATGRIAPLDITLFVDAGLSPTEVLATLKYTLDLRLAGNRAPFIFIAHTHVYASNYGAAPKAPDAGGRQRAIEDFVQYALTKPTVRMRPVTDLIEWMRHPQPLDGVVSAKPATGGAGGGAGSGGGGSAGRAGGGAAGNFSAGSGGVGGGTTSVVEASAADTPGEERASCSCRVAKRAGDEAWLSVLVGLGLARRRRHAR